MVFDGRSLSRAKKLPLLPDEVVALSVKGLRKVYRKRGFFGVEHEVRTAAGVSFSLSRGETLGIVSESRSGKSTAARCCMRSIEPNGGRIALGDLILSELSASEVRRQRKHIQMAFPEPFASHNPRQIVARVIAGGPVAHSVSRHTTLQKAREMVASVGLPGRAIDCYRNELSAGQRVGIARAPALEPDVLVVDETVIALDASVRAQILKLIKDIQSRQSLTILLVTDDLRVAAEICDRIVVIHPGKVVEAGEAFQSSPLPNMNTPVNCSPPCPADGASATDQQEP